MRIGKSPTRQQVSDYRPARVTVAVLVFIPEQIGYFHHRFEVLKLCLASLLKHTEEPYDLLVFDNGSCAEVVDYLRSLRDQGIIRYLLLSAENIGKIGAFQLIFNAAPGEIVAYCDEDTFFYPGWLPAHLKILDTFPNVGMVSGWAIRTTFSYGNQSCLKLAETDPVVKLERKKQIPIEWEIDYALSSGRDPNKHLATIADMEDIVLHYKEYSAYATAGHFQFVAPKSVITEVLPKEWSGRLMGKMLELDEAVDTAGYLRLSTIDRYVLHLGNIISEEHMAEAASLGISVSSPVISKTLPFIHKIARNPKMRQYAKQLYDRLYWFLHVD